MSQQINLFNPLFRKQKNYFSAATMAQALGLIVAGSVAVVGYAHFQTVGLQANADASATRLKATADQLARVSAEYAPRVQSKTLDEEIRRLEIEIAARQQAYDVVSKGDLGNTKGYSEYLHAFSRQIVSGVWLTGFHIGGAGNDIELKGKALKPDLVPAYLGRLKQEPTMKGKTFDALTMDVPMVDAPGAKGEEGAAPKRALAGYVEFVLNSRGAAERKEGLGAAPGGTLARPGAPQ